MNGTTSSCPVCAATAAAPIGAKGGFDYLRCAGCGLVYSAALPTPAQYAAAYGEYTPVPASTWKMFRKTVKLAPLIALGRARSPHRPLRFLDVGANTGYNTEAARRYGCEAHGLETNPGPVAFARREFPQCTFHAETIEQLATRGLSFDIIYCSEVLEHVPDPQGFVAALAALAHPQTTLFLTTPDSAHSRVPARTIEWKEVIPVEHLRLYDRHNLALLLGQHGFRVGFITPMLRANLRLYCSRTKV
jgi:SAM-dependent methyltransferase